MRNSLTIYIISTLISLFVFWAGGIDFNKRSFELGMAIGISMSIALTIMGILGAHGFYDKKG